MTKQERKDAIEELRACADTWAWGWPGDEVDQQVNGSVRGLIVDLLLNHPNAQYLQIGESPYRAHAMLETAALLEDGWNPGDELWLR